MIKFYQNNWHGIKFSSFGKNNLKNIADINFYNKFYNKFFLKFKYFDDLSNDWLNYKSEVAKIIQKQFGDKNNILSIGCGIGIVEKYIVENNQNINLTVIEPSKNACKWIENFRNIDIKYGYFPEILNQKQNFDIAYVNVVDYIFNKYQYHNFLKSIFDYGIRELIIVSASYYEPNFILHTKEIIRDILIKFDLYNSNIQFWGYKRSVNEQFAAISKAGFKKMYLKYKSNNTIVIKGIAK